MITAPHIIIAIDGYSSSGKSTMARALATSIGYRYIDSGAMYRAVTLYAMRKGLIIDGKVNEFELTRQLSLINVDFAVQSDGQHTLLNGEDVEKEIRGLDVSSNVSQVATIPAVRHALVAMQQAMGKDKQIVMDGRDIGTVVFPNAELKIFVDAPADTRAMRRYKELREKGENVDYEDILANVKHRDHLDETREESPLRRAVDAISLDNSDMTLSQQNQWLLDAYNQVISRI